MANIEIGYRTSPKLHYHPKYPCAYFDKVVPTEEVESKFNSLRYYYTDNNFSEFNRIPLHRLHEQLCNERGDGHSDGQTFWVMKLENDDVRPAYIPRITDLNGYMHNGVAVFVKWFYQRKCPFIHEFIPREVVPFFDMKLMVNTDSLPTFAVPDTPRELFIGENKFALHVMEVQTCLSIISVEVESDLTILTGNRYFRILISSQYANKLDCQGSFPKGSVVIIWNARNVHRSSFAENFQKIHATYEPMLVVMTEARSKWPYIEKIKKDVGLDYKFESISPAGLGGVLLAWDDRLEPYFKHKQTTTYGHIMSLNAMPSYKVTRGAPVVIPDGKYYLEGSDSEDDYDVMASWYTNMGMDDDLSIHDWVF